MADIAALAGIIALLGTIIYVLGLVAVAWPIYTRITQDTPTTWYAVNLVPRVVVAGLGINILMRFSILFLAGTVLVFLLPYNLADFAETATGNDQLGYRISIILGFWIPVGAMVLLCNTRIQRLIGAYAENRPPGWLLIIVSVISVVLLDRITWLLAVSVYIKRINASPPYPPHLFSTLQLDIRPGFYAAIVLISIVAFLLGLPVAAAKNPPLPAIKISKSDGTQGPLSGELLAHADGLWHFFDREGILVSICDEDIADVRVGKKTDSPEAKSRKPLNLDNTIIAALIYILLLVMVLQFEGALL